MSGTGLGRNYWKLLSATTVSNFGDGLLAVALPWLASAITRDPFLIALAGLVGRLPWLLFSLPAGVLVDRLDRRRLVAWTDLARGAVVLALGGVVLAGQGAFADDGIHVTAHPPASQALYLGLLYFAGFLLGSAEVVRDNSALTLLPSVVPSDRLEKANSRMWGAETVANQFIGPPLAGFLLGIALALSFLIGAGMFAVAAGLVFALAGSFAPKGGNSQGRRSWRAEVGEGIRWLRQHVLLRRLALILGVLNTASAAAMAVYVLYAQEVLELDARGFGLLTTGTATGAVLSSLLAERVSRWLGSGTSLLTAITGMGISLAIIGFISSGVIAWAALVLSGFLIVLWNVITVSLRQAIVPDRMLGRVNSVYRFVGWGTISLGSLMGGGLVVLSEPLLGREWSLRTPFLITAAIHLLLLAYALPRISTAQIEEARDGQP